MKKKTKREKKGRRAISLNLMLWLSFLLFAILLILIFSVIQSLQMNQRYRERISESVTDAARELKETLSARPPLFPADLGKIMLGITNRYGVSAYLFSPGGEFVYPSEGEEAEAYREIYLKVADQYEDEAREIDLCVFPLTEEEAGCAAVVKLWEKPYYLYVAASLEPMNRVSGDLRWYSVIAALFAVALSFVASGFVSMIITKPVSEVTEKAKELARGNYDVDFSEKHFLAEVNDLSSALNHASSEISKADKMQKELIANVSHDFKTPLTMIKGYASMIREISGDDPEKRAKHTQIIIDEADRLALLVGDVLDLSRLQTGVDLVAPTVFNLSEDVYRVVGRFGYLSETQGYTFTTEIEDDLYAFAGRERVEQVLYNLIGNAVNYTGEDKRVTVRLKREEGGARFEVIDSGEGIAEEELDTIWERYYRSSEAHKRPVQGTGLGLSIVKSVLLRYHLPFGVKSKPGEGSLFWVFFPDPPAEKES